MVSHTTNSSITEFFNGFVGFTRKTGCVHMARTLNAPLSLSICADFGQCISGINNIIN
jgi:hypothetical protein